MEKTKILIEIKGGEIICLQANKEVEYVVIDYDKMGESIDFVSNKLYQDNLTELHFHELFDKEADPKITTELKKLKF